MRGGIAREWVCVCVYRWTIARPNAAVACSCRHPPTLLFPNIPLVTVSSVIAQGLSTDLTKPFLFFSFFFAHSFLLSRPPLCLPSCTVRELGNITYTMQQQPPPQPPPPPERVTESEGRGGVPNMEPSESKKEHSEESECRKESIIIPGLLQRLTISEVRCPSSWIPFFFFVVLSPANATNTDQIYSQIYWAFTFLFIY